MHLMARGCEFMRIAGQIHTVEEKQAAEQQQLGKEKKPHAELGAVVILVLCFVHGMPAPLKS